MWLYFPLTSPFLVILIFISGVFSNIYQEMAANVQLASLANEMAFMNTIMTYLPIIVGVLGFIILIVMHRARVNAQAEF